MKHYSFWKDDFPQWCVAFGVFCFNYIELSLLYLAVLFIREKRYKIPWKTLLVLGLFGLLSLEATLALEFPLSAMTKQLVVFFLFIIGYDSFFSANHQRLPELFYKFFLISVMVAIGGCVQYIIYHIWECNIFSFLYSFGELDVNYSGSFRITSFIGEPGYLASLLLPPLAFLMDKEKKQTITWLGIILFMVTIILTDSSIGLLGIVIVMGIHLVRNGTRKALLIQSLLFLLCIVIVLLVLPRDYFTESDGIQKIERTASALFENSITEIEKENKSTYALLSNFWVARNEPRRLFGVGLGNHQYAYETYYYSDFVDWGQNKEDAYSLLIRIFSETGFFGLFVLFLFLRRINFKDRYVMAVSCAIIVYMLRGGNYFLYGTVFFFYFIYYMSKQNTLKEQINEI